LKWNLATTKTYYLLGDRLFGVYLLVMIEIKVIFLLMLLYHTEPEWYSFTLVAVPLLWLDAEEWIINNFKKLDFNYRMNSNIIFLMASIWLPEVKVLLNWNTNDYGKVALSITESPLLVPSVSRNFMGSRCTISQM